MTQLLLQALKSLRTAGITDEYTLQSQIADLMTKQGFSYVKEASLAPKVRVDFWVEDEIILEVKHNKPQRKLLLAQLNRYAQIDKVQALILVTEKSVYLPTTLKGKPLYIVVLNRLWGVAL